MNKLPLELVDGILTRCHPEDLLNLRLSCRMMNQLASRIIWSSLQIDDFMLNDSWRTLKLYCSKYRNFIKALTIRILPIITAKTSISYDTLNYRCHHLVYLLNLNQLDISKCSLRGDKMFTSIITSPIDIKKLSVPYCGLSNKLNFSFLEKLVSLKIGFFDTNTKEESLAILTAMSLPNLAYLSLNDLDLYDLTLVTILSRFPNLIGLFVNCFGEVSQVDQLVSLQSKKLKYFSFDFETYTSAPRNFPTDFKNEHKPRLIPSNLPNLEALTISSYFKEPLNDLYSGTGFSFLTFLSVYNLGKLEEFDPTLTFPHLKYLKITMELNFRHFLVRGINFFLILFPKLIGLDLPNFEGPLMIEPLQNLKYLGIRATFDSVVNLIDAIVHHLPNLSALMLYDAISTISFSSFFSHFKNGATLKKLQYLMVDFNKGGCYQFVPYVIEVSPFLSNLDVYYCQYANIQLLKSRLLNFVGESYKFLKVDYPTGSSVDALSKLYLKQKEDLFPSNY